jgi:Ca2+-binding RTX toxin-like protein
VELTGGSGRNYLVAGSGNETLNAGGSSSSNWLSVNTTASPGSTALIGGSGSDTLIGAQGGSRRMTGGGGDDAFVFFKRAIGGAADIIADFSAHDAVYIEGYGSGSAAELQRAATVGPGGLTLTLSDGTTITFSNLTDRSALNGRIHYG